MSFKLGDWIEHPKFGKGQIADDLDSYFSVRFVRVGEKRLRKEFITKPGAPPHPGFTFAQPKQATSGTSTKRSTGTRKNKVGQSKPQRSVHCPVCHESFAYGTMSAHVMREHTDSKGRIHGVRRRLSGGPGKIQYSSL